MTTSTTMTRPSLTTADLEAAGLKPGQVEQLVEMRARYSPFQEHFSEREFRSLNFLRWQIDHGRVKLG